MKEAAEAVFSFSSHDAVCALLLISTFILAALYLRARADLAR